MKESERAMQEKKQRPTILIKKLSEDAKLPTLGSENASGFDLYVPRDVLIQHGRNVVPLDIAIALPIGYGGDIRPRSGNSSKGIEGYAVKISLNGVFAIDDVPRKFNADVVLGLGDADYRGSFGVIVKNDDVDFVVKKGSRIAQMTICKYETDFDWEETDELPETARGIGGFGHTGI